VDGVEREREQLLLGARGRPVGAALSERDVEISFGRIRIT
jgi:hypothetical protein